VVVSLVLGFMVVWDWPAISTGVASLRASRLSAIYAEVAPPIAVFSRLFGKALEAQVGGGYCGWFWSEWGLAERGGCCQCCERG
jgi:hypothetical protein